MRHSFCATETLLLLPPGVVAYWGSPTLDCGGCHLRAFKMKPFLENISGSQQSWAS